MADEDKPEGNKQRAAYDLATSRLRVAHQEEFHTLREAAAKELGIEWKPRPSKEQREAEQAAAKREKAKEKVAALLAEHPDLAPEFLGTPGLPDQAAQAKG
jgi:hypothetical protein